MSDNISLIKKLLNYVESYEKEVNNCDLKEFAIYLKDKVVSIPTESTKSNFVKEDFKNFKSYPEIEFSTLLTGLFRFAKHYSKKAFLNTTIKTIDEFGFLATLLREKSLLKNELINKHHIEISSGSEIIKRLINHKLVYEYPDDKDKRAKRVSLTKVGVNEIMSAFDNMHKVSEIVIGNLDDSELMEALSVFNKLTYFHQHIHEKDKNSSLNELFTKYVPKSV